MSRTYRKSVALVAVILLLAAIWAFARNRATMQDGVIRHGQGALGTHVVQIVSANYSKSARNVNIVTRDVGKGQSPTALAGQATPRQPGAHSPASEQFVDLADNSGVINYATARFADNPVMSIHIYQANGASHPRLVRAIVVPRNVGQASAPTPRLPQTGMGNSVLGTAVYSGGIHIPPPGVQMDFNIRPQAVPTASTNDKVNAVLAVAQSKLGVPYVWGHNEDRGQRGFDCSNFTAYVYHHALGYQMTTLSRSQYLYVGVPVPRSSMRPGDLLIFDNGRHVGIYAGNNQMIEAGGGLGAVGYLSVAKGYWGAHLSAVKRMF